MTELVEVFQSPLGGPGGRGVRAKRDLKAGDLILREEPYSYVRFHTFAGDESRIRCDYCFEKKFDLRRCLGCKFVMYCNKDCQKAAWPDHKQECKSLKKATPDKILEDRPRLMAKMLWKRKAQQKCPPSSPTDENGFPNVLDELEPRVVDDVEWNPVHNRKFEAAYSALTHFMTENYIKDRNEVKRIFGIYHLNCTQVNDWRDGTLSLGYALYLKYAMFNHRCDPNCDTITTDGKIREVRAMTDIKKGEECFVTYTYDYTSTAVRNAELTDVWFFTCDCHLCQNKERNARVCGLKCGNCPSAVPFPPIESPEFVPEYPSRSFMHSQYDPEREIKCISCSWVPDLTLRKKYWLAFQKIIVATKNIEEQKEAHDWAGVKEVAEAAYAAVEPLFHRHNIMVKSFLEDLCKASSHLLQFQEWKKYADDVIEIHREVASDLTGYHIGLGVQYVDFGINCLVWPICLTRDVQLAEARKYLTMGLDIIRVTHGADHPLVKHARSHLSQCQQQQAAEGLL